MTTSARTYTTLGDSIAGCTGMAAQLTEIGLRQTRRGSVLMQTV